MVNSPSPANHRHLWVAHHVAHPVGRAVGRGGESSVFAFGRGVVKLYHQRALAERDRADRLRRKVEAMMSHASLRDDVRFAWPLFSVFEDASVSRWAGYSMRAVRGTSAQVLGALRTLQRTFPRWNRLHVATVAANLLDGLIALEREGLLIGDVSLNNFLVDETCRVSFIDLDSYQVAVGGLTYPCPVVTLRYAAPELLRSGTCAGLRTRESVRFSVGMLVYEVLTYGLSPYQRTWGDDPIGNLLEGKSAMGGRKAAAWVPPEIFSRYTSLHPVVMRRCIETFVDGHGKPEMRPSLEQWRRAIEIHCRWLREQSAAA